MPIAVSLTWGNLNLRGPSAWDAARNAYGATGFDALPRVEQIAAVRRYVSGDREPASFAEFADTIRRDVEAVDTYIDARTPELQAAGLTWNAATVQAANEWERSNVAPGTCNVCGAPIGGEPFVECRCY